MNSILKFYYDGFTNLTVGKTLWKLVIIKLLAFLLIYIFFFSGAISSKFNNQQQREDFISQNLSKEYK